MKFDFSNQIVMITGANGGIGSAIAMNFLEDEATVVLPVHRKSENINKLIEQYGSDRVISLSIDLKNLDSIKNVVEEVDKRFGKLNVLVNNAGITWPVPLEEMSEEAWDYVFDTNIKGPFFLTQKILPLMRKAGGGSIVNISSMSGHEPYPGMGAYSSSKAAFNMLTRQLALEWAPYNIRVNAVCPGLIRTPLSEEIYQNKEIHEKRKQLIPLKRIGKDEEIANVVSFISSSKASYMTGQTVLVDGGLIGSVHSHIVGRPSNK